MSVRRQNLFIVPRYHHQSNPQKYRSIRGSSLFQPTILYKSKFKPVYLPVPQSWIGKKMIPWNGELVTEYLRRKYLGLNDPDYISEYEIADYAGSESYRILYCFIENNTLVIKSKPQVDYVPSRLNICLLPDNTIVKIGYF